MYSQDRFDRVHDFVAFCEKKPASERYNWDNANICACGQFFKKGVDWMPENRAITAASRIDLNAIAGATPWKFGALAKRVRKELAFRES